MPGSNNPATLKPLQKFSKAVANCSVEASAYGKCIVADYNNVYKDKCAKEFLRLQECVGKQVKTGR